MSESDFSIYDSDNERVHDVNEKDRSNYYDRFGNKLELYETSSDEENDNEDFYIKKIKEKIEKNLEKKKKLPKKRKIIPISDKMTEKEDEILKIKPPKIPKIQEKKAKENAKKTPTTLDEAIDILLFSYKQYLEILEQEPLKFVKLVAGLVGDGGGVESYIKTAPQIMMGSLAEMDMNQTKSLVNVVKTMAFLTHKDKNIIRSYDFKKSYESKKKINHPINQLRSVKNAFTQIKKHLTQCQYNHNIVKTDIGNAIDKINNHLDHFLSDQHTYFIGVKEVPIIEEKDGVKNTFTIKEVEQILMQRNKEMNKKVNEEFNKFKKIYDDIRTKQKQGTGIINELNEELSEADDIIINLEKDLIKSQKNEETSKVIAKSFENLINKILLRQQEKIEGLKSEEIKENQLLKEKDRLRDEIEYTYKQIEQLKRAKLHKEVKILNTQLNEALLADANLSIELDKVRGKQKELLDVKDQELKKKEEELRKKILKARTEKNSETIKELTEEFLAARREIEERKLREIERSKQIREIEDQIVELKKLEGNDKEIEKLEDEIQELKKKVIITPSSRTSSFGDITSIEDLEDQFRTNLSNFIENIFNEHLFNVARKRILQNPNIFLGIALKEIMFSHIKKAHCEVREQSGMDNIPLEDLMFQEKNCIRDKFATHVAELIKLTQVQQKVIFQKNRYTPVKREVLREETIDFIRIEWQCLQYNMYGELEFITYCGNGMSSYQLSRQSNSNLDTRMMTSGELSIGKLASIVLTKTRGTNKLDINKMLSEF